MALRVYWARANGIVTGTSDTTFTPDRPVTRQEMAAILHRYAEFAGYDVSASADLSGYTDAGGHRRVCPDRHGLGQRRRAGHWHLRHHP